MSADLIQGKKGSGKSKLAVMLIQAHLLKNLRVCTNLDLFLDKLMPPMSKATALRIPDKPTAFDLQAAGGGNNGDIYDEEQDGLLVLDELALWLNARTFQDKDRGPVMDWFVHSRKYGWGTLFLCQDLIQVDKQVRESQVEYVTRCTRLDRIRIPIIGGVLCALFGEKAGELPKIHKATRRLGCDPKGLTARTWWYTKGGHGIEQGYNTLQVFQASYPHGAHSLLSAWHLVGRHLPQKASLRARLKAWWSANRYVPPAPKPKLALVEKVMQLPPHRRIEWIRRIEAEAPARADALRRLQSVA